ncbi:hypothetical protein P7C70_g4664, partial [Phenoliferia sp. Uapishka_3]
MREWSARVLKVASALADKADEAVRERKEATIARAVRKERYDSAAALKRRALVAWEGLHDLTFVTLPEELSSSVPTGTFYSDHSAPDWWSSEEEECGSPEPPVASTSKLFRISEELASREVEQEAAEEFEYQNGDFSESELDVGHSSDDELTAQLLYSPRRLYN